MNLISPQYEFIAISLARLWNNLHNYSINENSTMALGNLTSELVLKDFFAGHIDVKLFRLYVAMKMNVDAS